MGKFDSEQGLFHFVFANDDVYYSDSLIGMNLWQYLYFELRKIGYSSVYFLNGEEGAYELLIPDAVSADLYDAYEKPSFMGFFKGKSESNRSGKTLKQNHLNDFWNRMNQMIKKEKHLAFVISIEAFSSLRQHPELIESLRQADEKNYSRNHIIMVLAPVVADGSRQYLMDENGVFRSNLFPEIQKIFKVYQSASHGTQDDGDLDRTQDSDLSNRKGIYIYERLKEEMGERIVFLNRLEWQDIHNMVRHLILTSGPEMNAYVESIEDFTDFIWAIYHSQKFNQKMGRLFGENKKRQMIEIEKALRDKNVIRKMQNAVTRIRGGDNDKSSLKREILKRCPEDSWLQLIYEDNAVLRKLEKVPIDRVLDQKEGFTSEFIRRTLGHIKQTLKKPFVYIGQEGDNIYEYQCIDYLHRACERRDWLTMEKAVVALDYGIGQLSSDRSFEEVDEMISDIYVSDSRLSLYLKTVQISEKLYDITELYGQDGKRIESYTQQFLNLVNRIKAYEKEHAQVIMEYRSMTRGTGSGQISGELHMLSSMKSEAVTLQNDINALKHLRANKKTVMSKCKENIQKIEMAISSVAAGNVYDLKENMDYITKILQKVSSDNNVLLKELSDASETIQFTMEESAAMQAQHGMSDMEIDMAYEQMLEDEGLSASSAHLIDIDQ